MKTADIDQKKRPAPSRKQGIGKTNNIDDTTRQAQRQRLLKRLQKSSATTLEIRHEENILAVAARIFELRHNFDYNIMTTWTTDLDTAGRKHRIGRYTLLSGKWGFRNSKVVKNVKS